MVSLVGLPSAQKRDVPLRDHVQSRKESPCPFQVSVIHLQTLTDEDTRLSLHSSEFPAGCWVCHHIVL